MQSVLRKTGQVKIKIWISPRNSVTFNYFFFFCSTRQWGGRYPPANTGGGGKGRLSRPRGRLYTTGRLNGVLMKRDVRCRSGWRTTSVANAPSSSSRLSRRISLAGETGEVRSTGRQVLSTELERKREGGGVGGVSGGGDVVKSAGILLHAREQRGRKRKDRRKLLSPIRLFRSALC